MAHVTIGPKGGTSEGLSGVGTSVKIALTLAACPLRKNNGTERAVARQVLSKTEFPLSFQKGVCVIRAIFTAVLLSALSTSAFAQDNPASPVGRIDESSTYLLGPDDQITIRVVDAEEISDKPVRIGRTGDITLPMIGSIHAAGLTVEQLEKEIGDRLRKYFKAPEVWITRMEMRSQPVAVIGAVVSPGVHQLQGRKTLVEILSMAGGLKEDAGYTVKITRWLEWGRIPLPDASDDSTGQFSVAEVPLRDLTQAANPAGNIMIMPNDVITVPKADMVYVIGEVGKSGGIVMGGQQQVTVLQAVSMAAGLMKTAKAKEAKILRLNPSSFKRDEVRVDLKALLAGKIDDVPMQPEDILFIPNSSTHSVAVRALEAALQLGTGVAILAARP
ncbi:MAG: hypothetical protein DMG13_25790 [Acidobacteria bacterium]|nr:MAG: hypothetical protein DMG13_25790 [Acidobacteriota bacterium]